MVIDHVILDNVNIVSDDDDDDACEDYDDCLPTCPGNQTLALHKSHSELLQVLRDENREDDGVNDNDDNDDDDDMIMMMR